MAEGRVRLTFNERKQILKWYFKHENVVEVQRQWRAEFQSQPPTRDTIARIRDKFDAEGTVCSIQKSTGRHRTARSDENVNRVIGAFGDAPTQSIRQASLDLGLSRSSIQRILKERGIKPYRPLLLHKLNEDDFDRRLQFAEWFINQAQASDEFLDMIVWSDEASFKLNGRLNRHNCVYWSENNPQQIMEREVNLPGVNAWAAISSRGLIGPFFIDGEVNGANYLELLQTQVMPAIQALYPNDDPLPYFQQDGAPPHYARVVRNYLDENTGNLLEAWIGR